MTDKLFTALLVITTVLGVGALGSGIYSKVTRPQYGERCVYDATIQERVFIQCVEKAHGPTHIAAAGNDADEVVEECADSAKHIACVRMERYCWCNCE